MALTVELIGSSTASNVCSGIDYTNADDDQLIVWFARRNSAGLTTTIDVDYAGTDWDTADWSVETEWANSGRTDETSHVAVGGNPSLSDECSAWGVAYYYTGQADSITLLGMGAGSRAIEVFLVTTDEDVNNGSWWVGDMEDQGLVSAGTSWGGRDLDSYSEDSAVFAHSIYSSSVTGGDEGTWPGFHVRHTSNRFSGSVASLVTNAINWPDHWDSTFTWVGSRRTAFQSLTVQFHTQPVGEVTSPADGATVSGSVDIDYEITDFGNTEVEDVRVFVASSDTFTLLYAGKDATPASTGTVTFDSTPFWDDRQVVVVLIQYWDRVSRYIDTAGGGVADDSTTGEWIGAPLPFVYNLVFDNPEIVAGEFVTATLTLTPQATETLGGPGLREFLPAQLVLLPEGAATPQERAFGYAELTLVAAVLDPGLPRTLHGPPRQTFVHTLDDGGSSVATKDNGLALAEVFNDGVSYVRTADDGAGTVEDVR